jgi:hypothetical protein
MVQTGINRCQACFAGAPAVPWNRRTQVYTVCTHCHFPFLSLSRWLISTRSGRTADDFLSAPEAPVVIPAVRQVAERAYPAAVRAGPQPFIPGPGRIVQTHQIPGRPTLLLFPPFKKRDRAAACPTARGISRGERWSGTNRVLKFIFITKIKERASATIGY